MFATHFTGTERLALHVAHLRATGRWIPSDPADVRKGCEQVIGYALFAIFAAARIA
jgi:hypothetical protein